MAENRDSNIKARIPAGWEQKGKDYYCRNTQQQFPTLDALLGYVTYAKSLQPELFDLWSGKKSSRQKKGSQKRRASSTSSSLSDAEGGFPPQKKGGRKGNGASASSCQVVAEGTPSGKPFIVYERKWKLAAKKRRNKSISRMNNKPTIPNALSEMVAQKVAASRLTFDSQLGI